MDSMALDGRQTIIIAILVSVAPGRISAVKVLRFGNQRVTRNDEIRILYFAGGK